MSFITLASHSDYVTVLMTVLQLAHHALFLRPWLRAYVQNDQEVIGFMSQVTLCLK
jgi:hypothetical protein